MSSLDSSFPFTHVHQVLPSLHVADASGAHTLHARDALRSAGFQSELFVDLVDPPLAGEVKTFDQLDAYVVPWKTAIIYQLAVGSRLVEGLIPRTEPLIVNYHNLTPASFYWEWAPDWLDAVELGRSQLYRLAKRASHAIAVSAFNELDLRGAGYSATSVVPPFVDVDKLAPSPQQSESQDPIQKAKGATWLFVGKLLPHKAAHDLVRALAAYREAYDPEARLILLGGHPIAGYSNAIAEFAGALGIRDAVVLTGPTSSEDLAAAYEAADVFVCLSDHEGFCFPLLEAMKRKKPIVAFAAGAVPATLGNAGVLVSEKSGPSVAAAVHRVMSDEALRGRLLMAGQRRLAEFDLERTKKKFVAEVRQILLGVEKQRHLDARRAGIRLTGSEAPSLAPVPEAPRPSVIERDFVEPRQTSFLPAPLISRVSRTPEPIRAIHQLVPMLVPGDATSDHAILLRRLVQEMGLESEIFASAIHDDLHHEGILQHQLPERRLPGTLLIYQMSSASLMAEMARERSEPLAINYHNITPPETYDQWEPAVAADQRWARRQLDQLGPRVAVGICDSGYNAGDLVSRSYNATAICPVLFDVKRLDQPGSARSNGHASITNGNAKANANANGLSADSRDARLAARRRVLGGNWLFVGRIAPHKRQHRLVQTLAAYKRLYGEEARLDLVGRPGSLRYADAVMRCAEELGVADSVHVSGEVDNHELGAYYRHADVFVSASIHEGFGVPIVESMHNEIPVVALSGAALPETLDGAGLLVERDDPAVLAAAVHEVGSNGDLRTRLMRDGTVRAEELSLERSRETMRGVLERWIEGRGHFEPFSKSVSEPVGSTA